MGGSSPYLGVWCCCLNGAQKSGGLSRTSLHSKKMQKYAQS